jgi:hypothetical protein
MSAGTGVVCAAAVIAGRHCEYDCRGQYYDNGHVSHNSGQFCQDTHLKFLYYVMLVIFILFYENNLHITKTNHFHEKTQNSYG